MSDHKSNGDISSRVDVQSNNSKSNQKSTRNQRHRSHQMQNMKQQSPISNFSISQVSESLLLSPMSYHNVMNNSSIILMSGQNKNQSMNQSLVAQPQTNQESRLTQGQRNLKRIINLNQPSQHQYSNSYSIQSNKQREDANSKGEKVSEFKEESQNRLSSIGRSTGKEEHNVSFSNEHHQTVLSQSKEQRDKQGFQIKDPILLSDTILKNPKSLTENNTKLSLIEKQIDILDDLNSQKLMSLTTVYLSNNNLKEIECILQFPNIKNLSLSYNQISSFQDLRVLQGLSSLENLRLEGNPIVNAFPSFKEAMLCLLPNLDILDGKSISEKDRKEAKVIWSKQRSLIEMLFNLSFSLDQLKAIQSRLALHDHMFKLGYIYDFNPKCNTDLILKSASPCNFGEEDWLTWLEKSILFNKQFQQVNKFLKQQTSSWDQKFSKLLIQFQQEIALRKQQIESLQNKLSNERQKDQGKLSTQRFNSHHTPRVLVGSKLTIQSPKIIQTEYSPLRTLQEFSYNQFSIPKSEQEMSKTASLPLKHNSKVTQNLEGDLQMSNVKLKYGNENQNNFNNNQLQSVSFNLSTEKKSNFINGSASQQKARRSNSQTPMSQMALGSTVTKKKRKKNEKSLGDIQQMNLTKLLEVKENQSNYNQDLSNLLMDQTFSGLLLNDTQFFDPLASNGKMNQLQQQISPNSVLNSRFPPQNLKPVNLQNSQFSKGQTHPQPPQQQSRQQTQLNPQSSQEIEVTLQYLEKVETLESQLKQREQQNQELLDKNQLLVQKIKEFQEQNRSNVEQAREQILTLQKQLRMTAEESELNQDAQENLRQNLEYLEEENKVLQFRLAEIESLQTSTREITQRIQFENTELINNQKAKQLYEKWLKRRQLRILKRSSKVYYISEEHLRQKKMRREHFLKLLSFLYLRQNFALQKHIKQLKVQKQINLKYAIIYTLKRNTRIQQTFRVKELQKDYKILQTTFKRLVIHKQISEQRRRQQFNALQVRGLLLKNKAIRALKQNARVSQMPINSERSSAVNDMIQKFRKFIILRGMQRVIFHQIPIQNQKLLLALQKYKKTLLAMCFNGVFK